MFQNAPSHQNARRLSSKQTRSRSNFDDEKEGYETLPVQVNVKKNNTQASFDSDCKTELDRQEHTAPITIAKNKGSEKGAATDETKIKRTRIKKIRVKKIKHAANRTPPSQECDSAMQSVPSRAHKQQKKLHQEEPISMQLAELCSQSAMFSRTHEKARQNAAQKMEELAKQIAQIGHLLGERVLSTQSVSVSMDIYSVKQNRKLPTQTTQVVASDLRQFCENLKQQTADTVSGDADQVEIIIRGFDQFKPGNSHSINTWFDTTKWEAKQLNMRCKGDNAATVWVTVMPNQ